MYRYAHYDPSTSSRNRTSSEEASTVMNVNKKTTMGPPPKVAAFQRSRVFNTLAHHHPDASEADNWNDSVTNAGSDSNIYNADTPMTEASAVDNDATPKPRKLHLRRQFPVIRIEETNNAITVIWKTFQALREYHLLHSQRKAGPRPSTASWDQPEAGMLGFSKLLSLVSSRDVCECTNARPSDMMQKAQMAMSSGDVASFVVEATDAVLFYLSLPGAGYCNDLATKVSTELADVTEALLDMTNNEDSLIGQNNMREACKHTKAYLIDQVRISFPKIFDPVTGCMLKGWTSHLKAFKTIATELDLAWLGSAEYKELCPEIDEVTAIANNDNVASAVSSMVQRLYASLTTPRKRTTNALLEITVGLFRLKKVSNTQLNPFFRSESAAPRRVSNSRSQSKRSRSGLVSATPKSRWMNGSPRILNLATPALSTTSSNPTPLTTPTMRHALPIVAGATMRERQAFKREHIVSHNNTTPNIRAKSNGFKKALGVKTPVLQTSYGANAQQGIPLGYEDMSMLSLSKLTVDHIVEMNRRADAKQWDEEESDEQEDHEKTPKARARGHQTPGPSYYDEPSSSEVSEAT